MLLLKRFRFLFHRQDQVSLRFLAPISISIFYHYSDVALFVEERKLTAPLPGLSLHIVDSKGLEKDIFSLGEVLRVQVRMSDESKCNSSYASS